MQAIQDDAQSQQGVLLKDYGIDPAQAAELRASLASFADEWNQPEMDVYDDYEAANARGAVMTIASTPELEEAVAEQA